MSRRFFCVSWFAALSAASMAGAAEPGETRLFWGDTHVHTRSSIDAYFMGNRTITADFAYRFARGLPVVHPGSKARIQMRVPLDFLVITDHAEYLGVGRMLGDNDAIVANTDTGRRFIDMLRKDDSMGTFKELTDAFHTRRPYSDLTSEQVVRTAWSDNIEAADRNNSPGHFTTFIGWEWTSEAGGPNLHRNIFMPQGASVARQFTPLSMFQHDKPEDLWRWLEETGKRTGADFIAIPHNSNLSMGRMFDVVDSGGKPLTTQYARTRARWESVVEVTQTKGDSETHSVLSPTDEFADFERYEIPFTYGIKGEPQKASVTDGDYVRGALRRGLELETRIGVNPFKFGVVGGTDSHTGLSTPDEESFGGKMALDSTPEARFAEVIPGANGFYMSAQGRTGVWAQENTRESLFAAFRRREVYATTGPRIALRFFGGYTFQDGDDQARDLARVGYTKGVPMGQDLTHAPRGRGITFLIEAVKDPVGANLDRIQIIKGWIDGRGQSHERVYNVIASDGRTVHENKVIPVGNSVRVDTATYDNSIGDPRLCAVWSDPDFDPKQRAFYYARALEIPTPRHSLYDAVAMNIDVTRTGRPATIQERAYSSPIWYAP